MNQELPPYYTDPLHDKLDAAEDSVERWRDPNALGLPVDDAEMMDPLGQMLGQLEASIEWTTVPPLRPFGDPEPPPVMPGPPAPIVFGSFGPAAPAPQEPSEKPWGMVEPPPAARPYFAYDGLTNRPYHPQFGGGTGVRGETATTRRWCPDLEEAIEETACSSCGNWGDHGAGVEQCYYDWKQEEQDREEGEDET
jgi:hypothetical protein